MGKKRRYENKSGLVTSEKNPPRTPRGAVMQGKKKEAKQSKKTAHLKEGELKNTLEQLRISEEDVRHLEKDRESLREKIRQLEQAFASPSPRASAVKRLLMESPAPMDLKKPRLTPPDLFNPDELDDHLSLSPSENCGEENLREFANEFGLNIVGTTSIASQSSKSLLKDSNRNLNTRPKFTFKSSSFESNTTIIKKGYNGLGGQSKFLMPASKRPCGKVKIPKSSKASNTKRINSFMKRSPPLPNFFHSPQ